ncbi:MAG: hypothetical protein AAF638_11010 [Pseudomonadota bacterium]
MSDVPQEGIILPRPQVFVERRQGRPLDAWVETGLARLSATAAGWRQRRALAFARDVIARRETMAPLGETAFTEHRETVQQRLRATPNDAQTLGEAFAHVREQARRTLGLEPFPVQIAAAYAMYCGCAVEMDTGEGKTLAAMLPAAVHGLARRAVHLVAANDYLASRDCAELAPAYRALGLNAEAIEHDMSPDQRREVYRADVVYVSNKEVAFDYLRDRLARARQRGDANIAAKSELLLSGSAARAPVLRGLDVALVDEVDSVLVDDAGTPLLISTESGSDSVSAAAAALEMVALLNPDADYRLDRVANTVSLTDRGRDRVQDLSAGRDGPWRQRVRREELVTQALSALNLFRRDEHYLVRDDKIVIVDTNTGRTMADRFWGQGLHQMIELKEGCAGTGDKRPLITTTYQRFFRRYRLLAGTSGTIGEVAVELAAVYRLKPVRIPRRQPNQRIDHPRRVFASRDDLWLDMVREAKARRDRGQAVLIGVRSVEEAEEAAAALETADLPHVVLSAAQDADEADIIARAGTPGTLTVATNMAGRGTDIRLDPSVARAGGLAVFVCERHGSRRVDRQLIGRAARQGDPGEALEFVSVDDQLVSGLPGMGGRMAGLAMGMPALSGLALKHAQDVRETDAARRRRRLVASDRRMAELLAFTGGLE